MLQVNLVIEDAKISLDELQEEIAEIEDYVQSTDVAGECYQRELKLNRYSHAEIVDKASHGHAYHSLSTNEPLIVENTRRLNPQSH